MSRQLLARTAALFYVLNFVLGGLSLMWAQKGQTAAADQITLLAAADYAIVALLLGRLFEPADTPDHIRNGVLETSQVRSRCAAARRGDRVADAGRQRWR